ncbi:MarR family winged helix-turn-helix transcriptional regulator [Amycolatopsis circi]|uniref:MarR family winged helix-turn-helix transcriptional regulator n=1 Tax=Amycolatopsis circi TaxID=871959 RepID=UPI000E21E11C|nr:MarR family transcriptional regulator [Amycolatopsis circi]
MPRPSTTAENTDVDAVTEAVLTASRLLVAVSARSIAAAGDQVTVPQFRLLVILDSRGPMKHALLADLLGVTPSTASRMVDRLVGINLVERQHSPASRREIVVKLTAEGARVVRRVTNRRRREIADIVAKMPTQARRGLVDVLAAFAKAGGEPAASISSGDMVWD